MRRRGGGILRSSLRFNFQPLWSHDGTELFYLETAGASGRMAAVAVEPGMRFGRIVGLPGTISGGRLSTEARAFDVLPDGRFVGLVRGSPDGVSSTQEVRVVQNWSEELKRLAPVK